ncbi:MAG: zeta toxin family protein [Defluviicoccus sp.]|nr:zeta toxin family protein [Defluviicoccus sp.]MDG4609040.1 zeta toxin family protein [Defluviicoccus sp.]
MSAPGERPTLLVIAGPNGSGKSTLRRWLEAQGVALPDHIDPDEIASGLDGDDARRTREAQRIADERRDRFVSEARSFSFETVLSHPSKIAFMREAQAAGYYIILYYVAIADPLVNVARVADRVAKGGHDVPEERIRARYQRSMSLLAEAARAADRVYVFDNSGCGGERRLCVAIEEGRLRTFEPDQPDWVRKFFIEPLTTEAAP